MNRRFFAVLAAAFAFAGAPSYAQSDSISPKPQGAEVAFVQGLQKDLSARFSTPADAEKAGYFRYTNEDKTGAISYANLQWQSSDPQHPSQLWYSAKGQFLGADFSVLQSNAANAPSLWGVNPKRWQPFRAHVHYILNASGTTTYGATRVAAFTAAGGNAADPQAATLVKMGVAKSTADVERVFTFPALWDLTVWVTPNPDGAFAESNPLIKPTTASKDSM